MSKAESATRSQPGKTQQFRPRYQRPALKNAARKSPGGMARSLSPAAACDADSRKSREPRRGDGRFYTFRRYVLRWREPSWPSPLPILSSSGDETTEYIGRYVNRASPLCPVCQVNSRNRNHPKRLTPRQGDKLPKPCIVRVCHRAAGPNRPIPTAKWADSRHSDHSVNQQNRPIGRSCPDIRCPNAPAGRIPGRRARWSSPPASPARSGRGASCSADNWPHPPPR